MFTLGCRVGVAVSGGADSLALLDLFAGLGPTLGLTLLVAHADHGIQAGSAGVADRVRELAAGRYALETVVGALALGPDASETRARTARYRFLRAVQGERRARYLLTAHHADDQIETVLLRLLRGSAPAGLAGIPSRGPRGLVRPLLPFDREELRTHVRAAGLDPLEDPSNADPRHLRSWVRTVLVPAIEARLGVSAPRALLTRVMPGPSPQHAELRVDRGAAVDLSTKNKITVAFDKSGKPVTTGDLEVGNAMAAFMRNTINPTLMCTAEYNPCFVHAGPFANIAVGQSSIIADRVGLKLFDYHVTESGFAADIGFEKFWNVKCRYSGLRPHVSVLTTTIRALKMHGGGPRVAPGLTLPDEYTRENLSLVERGLPNMVHHIGVIRQSGINPVVCVNRFVTDTKDEVEIVRRAAEAAGARCAVSDHWVRGGEGALELADAVTDACRDEVQFKFLYPLEMKLRDRVEHIAREVYGADGVAWTPEAEEKSRMLESDPRYDGYATMMVKTHLSLSHDPDLKGVPKGWVLPIRDVLVYSGAKFLCPCAGSISLMPGTSSNPGFRRVDVDVKTGEVQGLF